MSGISAETRVRIAKNIRQALKGTKTKISDAENRAGVCIGYLSRVIAGVIQSGPVIEMVKGAWEKFKGTWNGRAVEDQITITSKECKTFGTQFKNALKKELADHGFEVVGFSTGHYDVSGFVKRGDTFVYVSYNVPRYDKEIDFDAHAWAGPVLYRTAENEKDYRGGHNNFCSLAELPKCVVELVSATEARKSVRLSA